MKNNFLWIILLLGLCPAGIGQEYYTVSASGGLHLRQSKSTQSKSLLLMAQGEMVQVLAKDATEINGYTWYKVKARNKTGYAAAQYLIPDGTPHTPVINKQNPSDGDLMIVNSETLRLRRERNANDDSNIVLVLRLGDYVNVLSKDATPVNGYLWYYVSAKGTFGHVASKYLKKNIPDNIPGPSPKEVRQLNREYWEAADRMMDNLAKKLDQEFVRSTFRSDAVAGYFAETAEKIKQIKKNDVLYPEILDDVNRKTTYLDLAARTVRGSFTRHGENALRWLVNKAVDIAPELLPGRMKGWIPSPDIVWLNDQELKTIEANIQVVKAKELETIKIVRTKYGLELAPW